MYEHPDYDRATAFHYAAYRPDLHERILAEFLQPMPQATGLDIGCGTGQSAITLSKFTRRVIGIEPSEAMLQKALQHPNVSYLLFNGRDLPFSQPQFSIITMAGSWFYAASQHLLNQLLQVLLPNGSVLLYDFNICLSDVLSALGIRLAETATPYNHALDFSAFEHAPLQVVQQLKKDIDFPVAAENLVHLLLSLKEVYLLLQTKYGDAVNVPAILLHEFSQHFGKESISLRTTLYGTRYHLPETSEHIKTNPQS